MARATPIWSSFNGGEFSSLLEGRVDIEKYGSACYKLLNFLPTIQGPVIHRPGFQYMGESATTDVNAWIVPFVFSTDIAFQLMFTDSKVQFYTTDGVLESAGTPYEVTSPYTASDLTLSDGTFGLSVAQSGDVLYIAAINGEHPPRKLSRYGNTDWRLEVVQNTNGPWRDANADKTHRVYASAREGDITLTSNLDLFNNNMIGSIMRLTVENLSTIKPWEAGQRRDTAAAWVGVRARSDGKTYVATDACTSSEVSVPNGGATLKYVRTGGSKPIHTEGKEWDGVDAQIITGTDYFFQGVEWQYEDDGSGIVEITGITSPTSASARVLTKLPLSVIGGHGAATGTWSFTGDGSDITWSVAGATSDDSMEYAVTVDGVAVPPEYYSVTGTTTDVLTLRVRDPDTGFFIAVPNGGAIEVEQRGTATGTNGETWRWELGAWSPDNEYPRYVCFWRERLWWFGLRRAWSSVAGDFENYADRDFGEVLPDSAVTVDILSEQANRITAVQPSAELVIGTTGGIATIDVNNGSEAFGPTNVKVEFQTAEGMSSVKPILIGGSTIFVSRDGRNVREFIYDFGTDSFKTEDLMIFAEHITDAKVTQMAFAASPWRTIWLVCRDADDGYRLLSLTWDKPQGVVSWARHSIGGDGVPLSVSVIPNSSGQDEVWAAIRRTINGSAKVYYERMALPATTGRDPIDKYPDSWAVYSGGSTTTPTGFSHLNGETVQVMSPQYCVEPDKTVSGGTFTLDAASTYVVAGLYSNAVLIPMRIEAGQNEGTAQGKTKRIVRLRLRLDRSIGGKIGPSESTLDTIEYRDPSDLMGQSPGLLTGDTERMSFPGTSGVDGWVAVVQDQPLPFTVVAIMPEVKTEG